MEAVMLLRAIKLLLTLLIMLVPFATITAQGSSVFTGVIDNAEYAVPIDLSTIAEGSSITIDAQATSGDLDLMIVLIYENGIYAAESDDRAPGNPNPYLTYENAPGGNYRAIVTRYGFDQGSTTGEFRVTVDIKAGGPVTLTTGEIVEALQDPLKAVV